MLNMPLPKLLQAARVFFDRDQRIPAHIAARLMDHGVIISRLEDQWSKHE